MNGDVDVIAETLKTRPLTEPEEVALARVERFVSHHDFAASRRSGFGFEMLIAGVTAAVVIAFIVVLTHQSVPAPSPARHTPIATTPSPSATPENPLTIPPFKIEAGLQLGNFEATAVASSAGTLWVAAHSPVYGKPGRLFRVDTASVRETGSWSVGGDPEAVSAAGTYVWVANSFGDGSLVLPDQNTVMQINAVTGRLVHVYPITTPIAIEAYGNGALVISSRTANGPTDIYRLTGGSASLVATVPGVLQGPLQSAQVALTSCGGDVYLGMSELSSGGAQSIDIYAMRLSGGPTRRIATLQGEYWPAMTCGGTTLFVFDSAGDPPTRVNLPGGGISRLPKGPAVAAAVADEGYIFDVYNAQGPEGYEAYISALSPNTGVALVQPFPFTGPQSSAGAFLLSTDSVDSAGQPSVWVVNSVYSASGGVYATALQHLSVIP